MSSPRVAHLVFDLIRGGTEGQCARIAIGLARQGLIHRVAVFHRRGFFLEEVEKSCGPVHEVAIRHLIRSSTFREIRCFADWLRAEQIDLLHAWDADAAIFGQFSAAMAGVPLVTSRRDLGEIYPLHKRLLLRRADRHAVRIVANARRIQMYFEARGVPLNHMEVLPNLLDLEERDRLAKAAFSLEDRLRPGRRIVVVNRLDPEKNTGLLIRALPAVRHMIPDAVLLVVGDGPEMPMLRELASSLGVSDAVDFIGENMEVPSLLTCCEVGALVPRSNEGLSNTILEYMAASLPVLATDCGGNAELVRDRETGRLLPLRPSPGAVAEAWVSLLKSPGVSAEMGKRGRLYVEQYHAPGLILDRFRRFYDSVADDGKIG